MSATGKIADFVERLEQLATPEFMSRLSQKLGGDIVRLVDDGIRRGVDPYGNPHPARTDGAVPLQGFIGTFTASWGADWIRVASSKWYAKVHQAGWKINGVNGNLKFQLPTGQWIQKQSVTIPQRKMIPTRDEGLGPYWTPVLMRTTEQFFRDHLQGRG
jgi:hypothetical protein